MQKLIKENLKNHLFATYWQQSKKDLKLAKAQCKKAPHFACLLAVQSTMNLFSAFLVLKKLYQQPSYSLTEMLSLLENGHPTLSALKEECIKLDSIQEFSFFPSPFSQNSSQPIPLEKSGLSITTHFAKSFCQKNEFLQKKIKLALTSHPTQKKTFLKFSPAWLARFFFQKEQGP